MYGGLKRMARLESGAANVVALALIFPLILYLGYSGVMSAHLGDVKVTMESAARAAARDYADHQSMPHAHFLAYEVVSGSLPVSSGQYNWAADCQVSDITVSGTEYAEAVVDYHYPVPIPSLPMLLNSWAGPLNNSEAVYGTAEFVVGT